MNARRHIIFLSWLSMSAAICWLAVSDYRAAIPMAGENLRGLALSLSAAIGNMAERDPSFQSLDGFRTRDIAYFSITGRNGVLRFHSNPDLIGSHAEDHDMRTMRDVFDSHSTVETRVTLGTGEEVYRFHSPIILSGDPLALCLTLHTYRADAVVRRARLNMAALLSLTAAGWLVLAVFQRYAAREERHRIAMANRERMAKMGEMGAMLAHEIRNPLAGIKGYAQLLGEKAADQRSAGQLELIVTECLRLETMVNNLLSFVGGDSISPAPVNLSELLAKSVSLIAAEAERLNVAIESDYPEVLQIDGDADRLEQLLLNLCRNALQAMPGGGILGIKAQQSGSGCVVAVSDNGEGMSRDVAAHIFEPFFTTKARGTGLGLALCKKIADAHNGTIAVESEPGRGTVFTVTLPGGLGEGKAIKVVFL